MNQLNATVNIEDNLAHEVQQGQRDHRVQILDLSPPEPPASENSAQSFLDRQSLLLVTTVQPAFLSPRIIYVPVNFAQLYQRVFYALHTTYANWMDLRDLIAGTSAEIDDYIETSCKTLTSTFIIVVYTRLRIVHGQIAPNASKAYRNRPPLDAHAQLPAGLIHLANQFGAAKPVDVPGNCIYLHDWDEEERDNFGLSSLDDLQPTALQGISRILHSLKVKFDKVQRTQEFRTAWDTIILHPTNAGFIAQTTMPIENYNLPRDTFLQVTLNRSHAVTYETEYTDGSPPAVYNYAMKISRSEQTGSIPEIETSITSTSAPTKKRKTAPIPDTSAIALKECKPHLFEQLMHPSGVSVTKGSATATKGSNPTITVFGRGSDDDFFPLNTIHRALNSQYICEYWNALFTSGP